MSNFFLCNFSSINSEQLNDVLNPAGTFIVENKKNDHVYLSAAYLHNSPLKGERLYEDDVWIAAFAGDLIGKVKVNFRFFITSLEKQNFFRLSEIEGLFSFAAFNKKTNKYYLVSDYRSQFPVFYFIQEKKIIFSSCLSSCVRILDKVDFNKEWLYQYLYFNFPVNNQTFLKNVFRMQPGSVLESDLDNNKTTFYKYYPSYKVKEPLVKDHQAMMLAKEVCKERFPLYYSGANIFACALTGGWDGRTSLALAPDYEKITAYTYGIPGCYDLINGRKTANQTKINHLQILFDEKFVDALPNYIFETVYLSSGMQNILRSTLIYIYKTLYDHTNSFPITVSGIGLDLIFRGHLGLSVGTSKDMERINRTGIVDFNNNFWSNIITENYNEFRTFILNELNEMKKGYGDYNSTEHHLSFHIYVASKEHFSGELKIANNFTTLRVPGWDSQIVNLAFQINKSCLSFSELTGYPRDSRETLKIQSYLLNQLAPGFAKIPIRHTTPNIVLSNKLKFHAYSYYKRISNKFNKILTSKKYIPIEDWNKWVNNKHEEFFDNILFNKMSLIRNYIGEKYLMEIKNKCDYRMLGKLTTIEIILQLINNRWNRFWEVN